MHLKDLKIENFRSFKYLNITFNPKLNVFIGYNGSGKSSILDIIAKFLNAHIEYVHITDILNWYNKKTTIL